jgi:hypothetical protein
LCAMWSAVACMTSAQLWPACMRDPSGRHGG